MPHHYGPERHYVRPDATRWPEPGQEDGYDPARLPSSLYGLLAGGTPPEVAMGLVPFGRPIGAVGKGLGKLFALLGKGAGKTVGKPDDFWRAFKTEKGKSVMDPNTYGKSGTKVNLLGLTGDIAGTITGASQDAGKMAAASGKGLGKIGRGISRGMRKAMGPNTLTRDINRYEISQTPDHILNTILDDMIKTPGANEEVMDLIIEELARRKGNLVP